MSSFPSSTRAPHGHSNSSHRQFPAYNPVAAVTAPAGTFLPGTKVQVGSHRVVVDKYLSEGGFAHVYVVRLPKGAKGSETAVLKRVAVPDKGALANMRTEVETMKKLKGHRHIVTYIDSHASQLSGGGFEVFLLMEYCAGGGLIDFMNTRLQNRLTEPEIIKIFSDVAEGVATMHYLKPPLLHRDLKVENVLISRSGGSSCYKLCDFGSSAQPRPAAKSAAEGRLIEDDVQRHTTMQYRSPEMIDVYRKQPIDEKSDIWALGVFLYKLCYYTTPFEEVGQMAILNATYKFPSYPSFSDRLKTFIASMLKEDPRKRPNIYEVVREVCRMQKKDVPIRDIYSNRTASEARRNQELPPTPIEAPAVGAKFSPPIQETQIIPEIAPMRRGRPSKPQSSQHNSAKPSPSPYRGRGDSTSSPTDPFEALDGGVARRKKIADELSNRFPTLDQFDILHEKGDRFNFEPTAEPSKSDEDVSQRLTNALADEAFAPRPSQEQVTRQVSPVRSLPARSAPQQSAPLYQPTPQRPSMVSTGTMTSPAQTPRISEPKISSRPIYRFPSSDERRPSSQPWADDERTTHKVPSPSMRPGTSPRLSSDRLSIQSNSARPSMEKLRRPTGLGLELDDSIGRSKSAVAKARPVSVGKIDLPRESETSRSSVDLSHMQYEDGAPLQSVRTDTEDRSNISSDVDYLRAMEEESNRKREKRASSGSKHIKRGSLSNLSLSGTKTLFGGRFGDAFRRFESSNQDAPPTPSPPPNEDFILDDLDRDDISPEMRRELERRRLSQEEKRVANAAAEYRRRVAEGEGGRTGGDGPRARAIQNKVQSLFGESNKAAPPPKTATGYGHYTESPPALQAKHEVRSSSSEAPRMISQNPGPVYGGREGPSSPPDRQGGTSAPLPQSSTGYSSGPRPGSRPMAPPKPKNLRVGGGQGTSRPSTGQDASQTTPATPGDDWEAQFTRRFPSLSGLEMETEIKSPQYHSLRTRKV
ncbi:hypothetical protein N7510_001972 [Penicillium lagena]|uniref:uncharacterized protein n=1 Tax=Penicillium lagena TaxID=94218 RepID=UPI002540BE80|nr:uncharacterized protein N7510_001972 [Penicillium lagena]KAJ5625663.1 hypothetical protein N7510_001972 [Penicillium lagena]